MVELLLLFEEEGVVGMAGGCVERERVVLKV